MYLVEHGVWVEAYLERCSDPIVIAAWLANQNAASLTFHFDGKSSRVKLEGVLRGWVNCGLAKMIEEAGFMCIFLPKFHPELNPIEMYWSWVKRYYRERTDGTFATALRLIEEALDACPLLTIRRFFRRVHRYASVYELDATGLLAEHAVKKYKSHRSITKADLTEAGGKLKELNAVEVHGCRPTILASSGSANLEGFQTRNSIMK